MELESKLNCQPVPACARYHTLSECVDGVAGRQVGAGDKVFTVGRLDLHPRPALQVAMETIHLTSGEGDVGNAALAAVPWRATTKAVMYKHVHIKFSHHNHDRQMHFRSVFFSLANVGGRRLSRYDLYVYYPAAELETQTQSIVAINSDGCVSVCVLLNVCDHSVSEAPLS